jgi:hypothetical protein
MANFVPSKELENNLIKKKEPHSVLSSQNKTKNK